MDGFQVLWKHVHRQGAARMHRRQNLILVRFALAGQFPLGCKKTALRVMLRFAGGHILGTDSLKIKTCRSWYWRTALRRPRSTGEAAPVAERE